MSAATGTSPEIGQLVEIRGRNWVVNDSIPSNLPPDALAGETVRQHLLALSSVEDDAVGEELQVVWEAEVGRRIRHRATLPDVRPGGFDHPDRLLAFLDAVRWGAITSAENNALQSPFRAGITIEEFQLEPLVRALAQPRVNLLIADDVGMGKTIEAGLIVQELLLRHRVRRAMVICPATLILKWKTEMAEKFGLQFTVVDSGQLRELRRTHGIAANPFRVYPLTIVSLQWLAGPRAQRLLDEVLPAQPTYPRPFDLLIVDEAHHVAPKAPNAHYAVDSLQTKAMRRLAQHFEHRLFLSATPHNGYRESWTALLALVDPLRFARGVEPDRAATQQVVVRRMKDSILNPDGSRRFPERKVQAIEVQFGEVERQAYELLTEFSAVRRARAGENGARRSAVDIATLLLKKRLFSSPAAFAKTIAHYSGTLHEKHRRASENVATSPPAWLLKLELAGEEESDDQARTEAEHDQLSRTAVYEPVLTRDEDQLLADMVRWAERYGDSPDAKALSLIAFLSDACRPAGTWNDERVLVFTEYRDTQKWLAELLVQHGLGGGRLEMLYGGQDEKDRERIKNAFQAEPWRAPVRILLGTDAAGEGIDLQLHCHRAVNYDIPFNPNRIEQRIGRIDRHGQRHQPLAYHFVGSGWREAPVGSYDGDLEFLARVARKVAVAAEDLGSINSVLEKAIQQHMTGRLDPSFDPMEVTSRPGSRMVRAERELRDRVEVLHDRLQESITALRLQPANVERVVSTALELARQPALQPIADPRDGGSGLFTLPVLSGTWVRASVGIEDPLTLEPRPITFEADRAADRQDVVLAHLQHPLVAMSTRLLRAAVWGGSEASSLHRVASCISDDPNLEAVVLAAYSRLVLSGADGTRLHEEVFAAGGWLRDGRFAAIREVTRVAGILDAALIRKDVKSAPPAVEAQCAAQWAAVRDALGVAITNRAEERTQQLKGRLEANRKREIATIDDVIRQFRDTLKQALNEREPSQLELFDEDERMQLRRDVDTWRSTLDGLDAHREQEIALIERRYGSVQAMSFPAALVFVVPRRLALA